MKAAKKKMRVINKEPPLKATRVKGLKKCPWCKSDDFVRVYIDQTAANVTCSPGVGGCGASGPVVPLDWSEDDPRSQASLRAQCKWNDRPDYHY